jgi:hypothetical protein
LYLEDEDEGRDETQRVREIGNRKKEGGRRPGGDAGGDGEERGDE